MQKFARVQDGRVVSIMELPDTIPSLVTDENGVGILDDLGNFQYVERPLVLSDVLPPSEIPYYFLAGPEVTYGWLHDGENFSAPPPPVATPEMRENAVQMVNDAAEQARGKYITLGSGQALTYLAKAEELRRYDADTNPVKVDYPHLSAEIGITGQSLTAVADTVRSAVAAWDVARVDIERVRLKAVADIRGAATPSQIQSIVSGIDWP